MSVRSELSSTDDDEDSDVAVSNPSLILSRRQKRDPFFYVQAVNKNESAGHAMRLTVHLQRWRVSFEVRSDERVAELVRRVRDAFNVSEKQEAGVQFERRKMALRHCGGWLHPDWILADIGLSPGTTLRAAFREWSSPVLHVFTSYNQLKSSIMEQIPMRSFKVEHLRGLVSRKIGLPVSCFRMIDPNGRQLFDQYTCEDYDLSVGQTILIETWDGWNDFLSYLRLGSVSQVKKVLDFGNSDDPVWRFRVKVSLYVSAHLGNLELVQMLQQKFGARSDQPVGVHPLHEWRKKSDRHVDVHKAAIHEAAETGNTAVLRAFVHHDICSVLARDGRGLTAFSLSLRQKQRPAAQFLLTKQWERYQYSQDETLSLSLVRAMREWIERARVLTLQRYGFHKSSTKINRHRLHVTALVENGIDLEGYGESKMASKSTTFARKEQEQENLLKKSMKTIIMDMENSEKVPEDYFKQAHRSNRSVAEGFKPYVSQNLTARTEKFSVSTDKSAVNKSIDTVDSGSEQRFNCHSETTSKLPAIKESATKASRPGRLETQRYITNPECNFPLPALSLELPQPFLVSNKANDPALRILSDYEKSRGTNSRLYAVRCLDLASSFEKKPWLQQVRQAILISRSGVHKTSHLQPHLFKQLQFSD